MTQDGSRHSIDGPWDLIIAHPPCTYLTVTGNAWFSMDRYITKAGARYMDRVDAIKFFMDFVVCNAKRVAIEKPIGIMSNIYKKPDQIIQPYMFGDPFEKKTCLWLKNLPRLNATNEVQPQKRVQFESGKSMPAWYADLWHLPKEERARARSKTFPGIARAMAEQWG